MGVKVNGLAKFKMFDDYIASIVGNEYKWQYTSGYMNYWYDDGKINVYNENVLVLSADVTE